MERNRGPSSVGLVRIGGMNALRFNDFLAQTMHVAYPQKPGILQLVTVHLPLHDSCFMLCI